MSIRHLAAIVFVGLILLRPLYAKDDSPRQFDIFFEPNLVEHRPQDETEDSSKRYPLYPNRFTDYLPGNLFDMRKLFESAGGKFRPGDFAWFNPDRNVLVVGASRDDLRFIKSYIQGGTYDPPLNIMLCGRVTVSAKRGRKSQPADDLSWQIYCHSAQRATVSVKGGRGIGHECEIECIPGPDGTAFEYNIALQATYAGTEYKQVISATAFFGKEQTMLLGTTPDGERVEFHLEAKPIWMVPPSPLEDAKWKAGLLKRLKSTLH